jgi:hypothetical protein
LYLQLDPISTKGLRYNVCSAAKLSKQSQEQVVGKIIITSKYLLFFVVSFLLCHACFAAANSQQKKPMFKAGEVVQGKIYGIKVIKVEKNSEYEDYDGRITPSELDNDLLILVVKFYKNGKPLKDKEIAVNEILKLLIVDANGHRHSVPLTKSNKLEFRYVVYGNDPAEVVKKEGFSYKVFFSIPKNSTGFQLQYRDLPIIMLGP